MGPLLRQDAHGFVADAICAAGDQRYLTREIKALKDLFRRCLFGVFQSCPLAQLIVITRADATPRVASRNLYSPNCLWPELLLRSQTVIPESGLSEERPRCLSLQDP